ncbi:MAG: hypothetical protein LLH30_12025 [Candidatus Manganitrophus sp. SA1]|nr:hypothetical protein [Candidatus Manganitrophus morganii]
MKQPAAKYAGQWGDERVEMVWLTRQAIPAKLVRSGIRKKRLPDPFATLR